MADKITQSIMELGARPREIFQNIVENYLTTGSPVGSRTLSRQMETLSPASIRNVMADLEDLGLLFARHGSAGREPTQMGLRLFVDSLLQMGDLTQEEQTAIDGKLAPLGRSFPEVFEEAARMLSGLSSCASLVVAPKNELELRHIEFVPINDQRALVVMVDSLGRVENRIFQVPIGMPPSALVQAGNFINSRIRGRSLAQIRNDLAMEIDAARREMDEVSARIVEEGLAQWVPDQGQDASRLLVRGQAHLLEQAGSAEDLEKLSRLLEDLERKTDMLESLDLADHAEGVRVFIGSENKLFSLSGSSLVVAPYRDGQRRVIGAIGVIGPTRLNYARIVPMVDHTARMVSRVLGES
ncbi:MAG TPA: heat-inducible transcriptional repressor HrcA [Alphaproteobacteria bacterium]|nr:heat-inducible transcriptional repressor HrcA [Paracoccaceae bacterium]RCL81658.1 MAG: heat-inducible transcriptional repressor HrcA [SAR116 cluster bacterium]RPH13369.1 MAG: heat-inducible transcriptional repressor HrcA [Alphaproteobacteria bacterium TMED150]HBQ22727.1 heat-inducible transcriptional repressor HrcA [Alphaproteobacteria bacterium]HCJ62554.1 heat-inducible transcriptional repressor HrcA [Alphaproteobacteria bacterium]